MQKTKTRPARHESQTAQATLTGETIPEDRDHDLKGTNLILWKAGQTLDDADPVRVAKWIVRLQAEEVI